jgi:hypothetical protein
MLFHIAIPRWIFHHVINSCTYFMIWIHTMYEHTHYKIFAKSCLRVKIWPKKLQFKTMCDCSVFAASVRRTARQTAAAQQSVSESIQNGFKFRLKFLKSTFFRPEEEAPWFELCKTQTTRQSFSVGTFRQLHSLDQLCNSVVYLCANLSLYSLKDRCWKPAMN